jgi:hypothetical protein
MELQLRQTLQKPFYLNRLGTHLPRMSLKEPHGATPRTGSSAARIRPAFLSHLSGCATLPGPAAG